MSALSFDRGESDRTHSPAGFAAFRLAGALRQRGVVVTGRSHAGRVDPTTARLVTEIASPTMTALVALTARPSDNFFAEMLLKALGARFGAGGTTSAGAAVVSRYLAELHLTPTVVDGSGLSRDDHTSPLDVVTLLRDLSPGGRRSLQPIGVVMRDSLPVAAQSGTLALRHARHAGGGTLRRQDRDAQRRLRPGRLVRRLVRVRVPDEPRRPDRRRARAGPDGDRAGAPRGALSGPRQPAKQREQPGLVEHRHAEPLGLLELGAGALAGDEVVGLLGDRARHAPAGGAGSARSRPPASASAACRSGRT